TEMVYGLGWNLSFMISKGGALSSPHESLKADFRPPQLKLSVWRQRYFNLFVYLVLEVSNEHF
ncbi:MAG: hypothetical protein ACE5HX_09535, partial [bacterium]